MKRITLARIARIIKGKDDVTPEVSWVTKMRNVTYPTGLKGRLGKVLVRAEGYRTRTMIVNQDSEGVWVY